MSNSQNHARKTERGFSLLELLLVVGVGALLLLAGIATYRLVTQGNNVNDAVRLLATIKQQTQRAFQGQPNYGAAGTPLVDTLVAMNAFPAGVLDGLNVPFHPWGGEIEILSAGAGESFTIEFIGVPSDACIQLGSALSESDTDFISLTVATTAPYCQDGVIGCGADKPVTVADLTTDCITVPNPNMLWRFF